MFSSADGGDQMVQGCRQSGLYECKSLSKQVLLDQHHQQMRTLSGVLCCLQALTNAAYVLKMTHHFRSIPTQHEGCIRSLSPQRTISTKKTKVLLVGSQAAQAADAVFMLHGDQLEVVSQLQVLGSILTSDCTLDAQVKHRVGAADSVFQQASM